MSRHCRKRRKPVAVVKKKSRSVPLWWKLWIAVEDPLQDVVVGLVAVCVAALPFVVAWLLYLIYLR